MRSQLGTKKKERVILVIEQRQGAFREVATFEVDKDLDMGRGGDEDFSGMCYLFIWTPKII